MNSGVNVGIIGAGVRALVFVAIIAYLLRFAVAPIRRIAGATERIAGGDLDVKVPEKGPGEIGQLARSFNKMAESLVRQQHDLESQNVDLERLANVLRAVLDSTVDGILLSDCRRQRAAREQAGAQPDARARDELRGARRRPAALRRAPDQGPRQVPRRDGAAPLESRRRDVRRVRGCGERTRRSRASPRPCATIAAGSSGRIWTLREVTQQRELDRLKDDFVATVSHELRTPLTSMMGFLEMIREGEAGQLTDEQKRFLAIVYRSSERLQRLVGDLLFVARLDASGLQLHFAPRARRRDRARGCRVVVGARPLPRDRTRARGRPRSHW